MSRHRNKIQRAGVRAERDIVKAIIYVIRDAGGYAIKVHGSAYSEAGTPDINGCYKGLSIWIEAKTPGQKPSALQRSRLRTWEKAGALTMWCDNVAPVRELLKTIDHITDENYRSKWDSVMAGILWAVAQISENGQGG